MIPGPTNVYSQHGKSRENPEAVSGGKPRAGKGVVCLLSWHGSQFWVCITFCKVRHSDSVTKPDYYFFQPTVNRRILWHRKLSLVISGHSRGSSSLQRQHEHMLHCPSGEQLIFSDTGEIFHLCHQLPWWFFRINCQEIQCWHCSMRP